MREEVTMRKVVLTPRNNAVEAVIHIVEEGAVNALCGRKPMAGSTGWLDSTKTPNRDGVRRCTRCAHRAHFKQLAASGEKQDVKVG